MQVLFVEDDPMNRRVVKDMLRVVGADMEEAADAETGLRMIDEGAFNVVLMDLRMPGMNGLEAIRHLRAMSSPKATLPVIVVTADTATDLREQCLSAGADDVILKPVAMGALLNADVPPFVMVADRYAEPRGINAEGLKRRGFDAGRVSAIKRAYKSLYLSKKPLAETKQELADAARDSADVAMMLEFIERSERGLLR